MLKFLENLIIGDSFNTSIQVTFIDHLDNGLIVERKMEQFELPEDFKNVDTIFFDDQEWHLIKAEPDHAHQFSLSKKLILRIASKDFLRFKRTLEDPSSGQIRIGTIQPL